MGEHLINGEFQSDKYPTCPRGKVPLSVNDSSAQDLLWQYAQRRRVIDAEFAADLEAALRLKGFVPSDTRPPLTHVACRDGEGRIWSLPRPFRHHHVIKLIDDMGGRSGSIGDQGFLDASGRYLTRQQALVSADINDQIKNGKIIGGVLTSEDLW